jgi:pimeloyl-ACP methyl ester carboxylesterase
MFGIRFTTRRARRRQLWISTVAGTVAVAGYALLPGVVASAAPAAMSRPGKPTIVLEHGAWADGSSWRSVIERLQHRGFTVLAPPNQLRGGAADSTYLASYLRKLSGPVVLVGHSYGGVVITNAAVGNTDIKALVYIDAYIPDAGDNILKLSPGSCLNGDPRKIFDTMPYAVGVDLYLQVAPNPPYPGSAQCFANGLAPQEAAAVASVQRPLALSALAEPSGVPAWRTIPSWSLIGTDDRVIPPAQQQFMSNRANAHIATTDAGHLSLVTRPDAVTEVIVAAVDATS